MLLIGDLMLLKKLLRDFKDNRKQFIAIFLMSFITLLAFSGIGAEVQVFKTI